jgi:protein TonB
MKSTTAWHDSRPLHFALGVATSILLHLPLLLLTLQPGLPPQEEHFSQQAIEVTLEKPMAPPATPAPPAMAEAGQARPPGSIDLVHTALAPGPADTAQPLQRPLSESPAALPLSSAWQPADAALEKAVMVHAPDPLDRIQAPPTAQPQRQAAHQASQQTPASPSAIGAGTGAPDRTTDTASHASQRDAQQDYVMQVVRRLSQVQFSTEAEFHRSPRGALIARLTVDRDGNLVGLSLAKNSGSASVDRSILDKVRKTAPFAPLPKDLAASRFSFIVPITYAQEP